MKDTITPLLLAAASAGLNILLGIVLMGPMGDDGLALANSVAVTLEVLALLFILGRRIGGVEGRETGGLLVRVLGATAIMSVAILGAIAVSQNLGLGNLVTLAFAGAAGALVYVAAAYLLRVRELGRFVAAVIGRPGIRGRSTRGRVAAERYWFLLHPLRNFSQSHSLPIPLITSRSFALLKSRRVQSTQPPSTSCTRSPSSVWPWM